MKKILVFYIFVGNIDKIDRNEHVEKIAKTLNPDYNSIDTYFVPTLTGESRVECINPEYITDKDLIKEHEVLMSEFLQTLKNEEIDVLNYGTRKIK